MTTQPPMTAKQCRWGILGAAVIARKNWQAIHNSGNGTLVAVASRSLEKSQSFIRELQTHCPYPVVPEALGSYEALLARSDIDAVYVPLPTALRTDWVVKAVRAGKHVLVEKPVGVTASDVERILAACREHGRQFMDGVMLMHSQRLNRLRETLDDGLSVGIIRRVTSHFSFSAGEEFHQSNIRVASTLEPLGCLGDLGWYNIRFALWAMRYQLPQEVTGRLLVANEAGVPLEFSAEMIFPSGASASFFCSFQAEIQQWASISGTKGHVQVSDFVLPFYGDEARFRVINSKFETTACQFDMREGAREVAVPEFSNNRSDSQESRLFRKFGELVLSGMVDPTWGEMALKTQRVMDACLLSAREGGRAVPLA